MELITPLTEMVWSFALIAFYCEFSQMMCQKFSWFSEEVHHCDWYLFPIELKRLYLIFLLDVQQLSIVRGYGNILCTRDTFKTVLSCSHIRIIEQKLNNPIIIYFLFLIDDKYWIFLFYDAL